MEAKMVLKEFILDCEMRKLSAKTIKGYRNNNTYLLNFIEREYGIIQIEEITHLYIKAFLMFLQKNGRKTTYTNGLIKTFRSFFKYLKQEEYIQVNPMEKVRWGKQNKPIIKTFTHKEVALMIKAYAVIFLKYGTGRYWRCYLIPESVAVNCVTFKVMQ